MREDEPNTSLFAAAGVIAISCAVLAGVVLRQVATPPDYSERLSALSVETTRLERASKTRAAPLAHRRDAVCTAANQTQLEAIQQRIGQAASGVGVTVASLTVTPMQAESRRLTPLRVQLEANGPYDRMLMLLSGLTTTGPELFVDRLDLRQGGGSVHLSLSSKVFCWNDAQS